MVFNAVYHPMIAHSTWQTAVDGGIRTDDAANNIELCCSCFFLHNATMFLLAVCVCVLFRAERSEVFAYLFPFLNSLILYYPNDSFVLLLMLSL